MTTKKQRREETARKRAEFEESLRKDGLASLRKAQERRERIARQAQERRERIARQAKASNDRLKESPAYKTLNAIFGALPAAEGTPTPANIIEESK